MDFNLELALRRSETVLKDKLQRWTTDKLKEEIEIDTMKIKNGQTAVW